MSSQFNKLFISLGRLYAMQKGIKIDSKGKDSRPFLLQLMDQLEKVSGTSTYVP